MSQEIPEQDLNEVRLLVRQVGVAEERVDLLLQQTQGGADDAGLPRVLMASAGEGTLELLLSRWLGEEAGEAIRQVGLRPLVIGPEPERVRPQMGLGTWKTLRSEKLGRGRMHVVAVTATGALSGQVAGELVSAGAWDVVIVVTRASMPLSQAEREMVQSLSQVAAVAKVLVVVVPGELPAPQDTSKIEQYARSRVEASGFNGGRCDGVWFWWLDGQKRHLQAVREPGELLTHEARATARGRELMLRSGLSRLLKEIEQKAASSGIKPLTPLNEEDLAEMEENFDKALTGVRRRVEEEFREAVNVSDADLRRFVVDQILAWERGDDLAGVWLNYVENVRPGAKAGLFEQARSAASVLSLEPAERQGGSGAGVPAATERRAGAGAAERLRGSAATEGRLYLGVAVVSGVMVWAVTSHLLAGGVVAAAAGAVGAVVGFAFGRPVIEAVRRAGGRPVRMVSPTPVPDGVKLVEGKVRNFAAFEHDLRTWLSQHIRSQRVNVAGRGHALAQRWGLAQ